MSKSTPSTPHWLPCTVKYDGKANVDKFFKPETDPDSNSQHLLATFRGRQLRGTTIDLPKGYIGGVMRPMADKPSQCDMVFHQITYWNHDLQPSRSDLTSRALEWLHLAPEMHKEVSVEEVEAELDAIMSKPHVS